jgi:thiamine pyrophosphate-dependent acetolactate synthase large subunit-like protein
MTEATASSLKVYSAIAKALVDNDVRILFGLVGDANLYMVDSFKRDHGGIFIAAAHEAGAALMALGYASVSGNVGVATVTHGPALVNTLTALVEGVKGSVPMVLLCGDTAAEDRDNLQNVSQRDFIIAAGAGFEQLRAPGTLSQDVATALRRAIVERRPIALNVPVEFQWSDVDYRPIKYRIPDARTIPLSTVDLDDAIGVIAAAKRPIILAGRGATSPDAKQSILRLADRIEALLATTLKAKDLFQGELYDIGVYGTLSTPDAVEAIMASDCIIAFGASLNRFTTARGAYLQGKRVVQINLEQAEIGKNVQPSAGVVGDPALVADTIVHWLDEAGVASSGFRREVQGQRRKSLATSPNLPILDPDSVIDLQPALLRLNEIVPANRILVTDGGRFVGETWKSLTVVNPASFLMTVNFGSIGLGLSQAIGASLAADARPVLLVTGDGGFMLGGLTEFNTAVRHRRDLIVVVCNDGSYGAEHIQFRNKNMDPALSLFDWPDFAPVAIALGGAGITVRTYRDLDAATEAIKARDRPLLIDLKLDPDRMPPLPV